MGKTFQSQWSMFQGSARSGTKVVAGNKGEIQSGCCGYLLVDLESQMTEISYRCGL